MEYKCSSCREISALSPKAKFCPVCGSSSLILVVKEKAEPSQKETIGVYKSATIQEMPGMTVPEIDPTELKRALEEEEDKPRRKR